MKLALALTVLTCEIGRSLQFQAMMSTRKPFTLSSSSGRNFGNAPPRDWENDNFLSNLSPNSPSNSGNEINDSPEGFKGTGENDSGTRTEHVDDGTGGGGSRFQQLMNQKESSAPPPSPPPPSPSEQQNEGGGGSSRFQQMMKMKDSGPIDPARFNPLTRKSNQKKTQTCYLLYQ